MTKSSLARRMRKAAQRSNKRLEYYLKVFGAAYAKFTNVHPNEAVLIHEVSESKDPGTGKVSKQTRFFFEHHGPHAKIAGAHPDIQLLIEVAFEIVAARKRNDTASVEDGIDELAKFTEKYTPKRNTVPSIPAAAGDQEPSASPPVEAQVAAQS